MQRVKNYNKNKNNRNKLNRNKEIKNEYQRDKRNVVNSNNKFYNRNRKNNNNIMRNSRNEYSRMFIPRMLNIGFNNRYNGYNNRANRIRSRNYPARNNNNRIVDLILNPYKMALANEFYSIFPSQSKVIKYSTYATYNVSIENDDQLLWMPYGIGFRSTMDALLVHESQESTDMKVPTRYFNVVHKHDTTINLLSAPLSEFKGKYRIIGASLKITNTTPLNSRGGTFFIANNVLDDPIPSYSLVDSFDAEGDVHYSDALYGPTFYMDYNNVPIKANFSGLDIVVINEINNKNGNNIFTSSDEFMSAVYFRESGSMTAGVDISGAMGINSKYVIKFNCSEAQSYLFETWTIVELCPDPGTGVQSLAIDSSKGISKRISKIIDTTNHIVKL